MKKPKIVIYGIAQTYDESEKDLLQFTLKVCKF